MTSSEPSIDQIGPARCTGCFGCQSSCAMGAVAMALDADGFYKPVVDRQACNECGACARSCPVIPDEMSSPAAPGWSEPKAFAAWANDDQTRLSSSSGGIFSELAAPVIAAGGSVAGCIWGPNWSPEHRLARSSVDVERMRGSKYVPSRVGDAYQDVIAALRGSDGPVLFSGAPCQVAAMERALSSNLRSRVLLVEFVCHGVPSLRAFHRYLDELFQGEPVASYTFRDKTLGWQTVLAVSASGRRHQQELAADSFGRGFAAENLFLMEACYECPFARLPRGGDITLADFWGCPPEWHDRRGVSLALASSPKGMLALEAVEASGRITLMPTDMRTATASNRRAVGGAFPVPRGRRAFLDGLAGGESFSRLVRRYSASRWQVLWKAFRESRSKPRFIAEVVQQRLRRVLPTKRAGV